MSTYRATATREGRFWVVDVDGVGVTQGRTVREAQEMAADLVVAVRDVPAADVEIDLAVELPGGLHGRVREARQRVSDAERSQKEAAALLRTVVGELRSSGLAGQDLAAILGVSPQRVSQLAPTGRTPGKSAKKKDKAGTRQTAGRLYKVKKSGSAHAPATSGGSTLAAAKHSGLTTS